MQATDITVSICVLKDSLELKKKTPRYLKGSTRERMLLLKEQPKYMEFKLFVDVTILLLSTLSFRSTSRTPSNNQDYAAVYHSPYSFLPWYILYHHPHEEVAIEYITYIIN